MTIMQSMVTKSVKFRLKGFTLIESLLTLFVVSFLAIGLSGSISETFQKVENNLFFLSFEHCYQESQRLSASQQEPITLKVTADQIDNGYDQIGIPKDVRVEEETIVTFDKNGGNNSLAKIRFMTTEGLVTYQLYLGSGKYQKKTN